MDLRKRVILNVGIPVLVLIIIFVLVYFYGRQDTSVSQTGDENQTRSLETGTTGGGANTTGEVVSPVPKEFPPANPEDVVRQLATIFVERFATYSNQNENHNIDDVLLISTKSMASWLETQRQARSNIYEGTTTRVLVADVDIFTNTSATVLIQAQQTTEKEADTTTVVKRGRVDLVDVDGEWRVDGLYWDKE